MATSGQAEGVDDVAVDEALFLEEVDEESDKLSTDDAVDIDESLFNVDNLQDLDLNDPAILETPGGDS